MNANQEGKKWLVIFHLAEKAKKTSVFHPLSSEIGIKTSLEINEIASKIA